MMSERDEIYIRILHLGLVCLRNAAALGEIEYIAAEADHLHNLPSLIGESNEQRHAFYLGQEHALYLERVDRTVPGVEFTLQRYEELWQELDEMRKQV